MSQPKLVHHVAVGAGQVGDDDIVVAETAKDLFGYLSGSS
jgi:hypothetical protein